MTSTATDKKIKSKTVVVKKASKLAKMQTKAAIAKNGHTPTLPKDEQGKATPVKVTMGRSKRAAAKSKTVGEGGGGSRKNGAKKSSNGKSNCIFCSCSVVANGKAIIFAHKMKISA
jgi:hypothetical protein